MLTDLADAARKSGLTVVEIDGWRTNGRPASTGPFDPRGVLCHHTGSYDALADAPDDLAYARWLANQGRDDLPAPLCHLALSAEGVVYVTAAGRANHAGTAKPSGPVPGGDGNELYIGIEAMNNGTQGWTPVQYDAYVRLCRALVDHYGWTAQHVRAHKETSYTGKWDPGGLDMNQLRADVARDTPLEDDMQLSDTIKLGPGREVTVGRGLAMAINQSTYGNAWAKKAASAARTAASGVADLARLVGDTTLTPEARTALAEDIAARTAAAVEAVVADLDQLTAAEVADQLEITVKES